MITVKPSEKKSTSRFMAWADIPRGTAFRGRAKNQTEDFLFVRAEDSIFRLHGAYPCGDPPFVIHFTVATDLGGGGVTNYREVDLVIEEKEKS